MAARLNSGLLVLGLVLGLIGAGLIWLGLDGLLGLLQPTHCSPPGNPDCLPIPGEETGYRDAVATGAVLLLGGGVVLGRATRPKTVRRPAPGDAEDK